VSLYKRKKNLQELVVSFQSGRWEPVADVERPFVRHRHNKPSPGAVWQYSPGKGDVNLSVVIPTSDAYRGGYFLKLLSQIDRQDYSNFELIVVQGDPRQGRAINIGASLSKGNYLLTLDDDTSLPDNETFSKLVTIMDTHPEIGIAGGNNVIPEDASLFVRRVMKELPRRAWEPVSEITDSDLAEHPCLIMRTAEFKSIGGENELIPRGLDPYLRQEYRKSGKRVVVVPNVIYHHLPPDSLPKLLKQSFRNGRQAAFVNRYFPQWVIETPSKHGTFVPRRPLWQRILRYPLRLLATLVTGRWMWFIYQIFYASGFVFFWLTDIWKSPSR
jgi:glycosyltransferase involved in cell wall biosynthesis